MKKLKGIIIVIVSILFPASVLMPFNIYADTLPTSEILGVDARLINEELYQVNNGNNYRYLYEVTVHLKNNYIGYIAGTLSYSYYDNNGNSQTSSNGPSVKYVNGNEVKYSVYITRTGSYNVTGTISPLISVSYLLTNSNVTKYEDIDSIHQVLNIMNDLYNSVDNIEGLENNQLTELTKILTSLNNMGITLTNINGELIDANSYLDVISNMRQWDIFPESYSIISWYLYLNYPYNTSFINSYYNYPLFSLASGTQILQYSSSNEYMFIFYSSALFYNSSTFSNLHILTNCTVNNIEVLNEQLFDGQYMRLYKIRINRVGSGMVAIQTINNIKIIPLYLGESSNKYISTDFALLYGLSNRLLDNLDIIANGTNQSNQANQQLDSNTSQFQTDSNDLIDIEDTMSNNMDTAMQQITPSSNPGTSFGGNFLTSAVWVRTQFERLTNGNPFGSLIVYGLTLGLALLLLGKVFL